MRDVCDFKETLPETCNVVNGITSREGGKEGRRKVPKGKSFTGCGMRCLMIHRVLEQTYKHRKTGRSHRREYQINDQRRESEDV